MKQGKGWRYFTFLKSHTRYFERVEFDKPDSSVLAKALKGIINSERAHPYFIHAAPLNPAAGKACRRLESEGFLEIDGVPGEGKTLLAFQILYLMKREVILFKHPVLRLRYQTYQLKTDIIEGAEEIDSIIREMNHLRGGRAKIILADDMQQITFGKQLRRLFEEEVRNKNNGKFIWVDTNYSCCRKVEDPDCLYADFEKLWPVLQREMLERRDPEYKKNVEDNCPNLEDALSLKQNGKIKDIWQFFFTASNGEKHIDDLLQRFIAEDDERNSFLPALFLFAAWNVMTGGKMIAWRRFEELLNKIEVPSFRKGVAERGPAVVIAELLKKQNGGYITVRKGKSAGDFWLTGLHYRFSQAIIRSLINSCEDESLVRQLIDTAKVLLTDNYNSALYANVFFNLLGRYGKYFLSSNKEWVTGFLSCISPYKLQDYVSFLQSLGIYHKDFLRAMITDSYLKTTASRLSLISVDEIGLLEDLIRFFKNDNIKIASMLDWDRLARTANEACESGYSRLAGLIDALGEERNILAEKLDPEVLACSISNAPICQFREAAYLIHVLGNEKNRLVEKLDLATIAASANRADISEFGQLHSILNALDGRRSELISKMDFEALASAANGACSARFGQLESVISALGTEKYRLTEKLDLDVLARKVNRTDVIRLAQVAQLIAVLGTGSNKIIRKLNWEALADTINKADVEHLRHAACFINSLGENRCNIISKLEMDTLAHTASRASVSQFPMLADFIHALKNEKEKFTSRLDLAALASSAGQVSADQIRYVVNLMDALGELREKFAGFLDLQNISNELADALHIFSAGLSVNK